MESFLTKYTEVIEAAPCVPPWEDPYFTKKNASK